MLEIGVDVLFIFKVRVEVVDFVVFFIIEINEYEESIWNERFEKSDY